MSVGIAVKATDEEILKELRALKKANEDIFVQLMESRAAHGRLSDEMSRNSKRIDELKTSLFGGD